MPHRSRSIAALVLILAATTMSPAAAEDPHPSRSPAARSSLRDHVIDRVSTSSRSMYGELSDALTASYGLLDIRPASDTCRGGVNRLVDVPLEPSLSNAIGDLLLAVDRATCAVRDAAQPSAARLDKGMDLVRAVLDASGSFPPRPVSDRLLRRSERMLRHVDRPLLYGASLNLTRVIDDVIPTLRSHTVPRSGTAVTGCDELDVFPAICIGGEGDNEYVYDYALSIDLGGDDRYENSAGAADVLGNGLPVSIVIDVAGDDVYDTSVPTPTGAGVAQGSSLGGIGALIDLEGDDSYDAHADEPAGTGWPAPMAQGVGIERVGILADMSGADTYRVSYRGPAVLDEDEFGPSRTAWGQGLGFQGGLGMMLDRGSEDDTALVESVPPRVGDETNPRWQYDLYRAEVGGQGFGAIGGVGVSAYESGQDVLELRGVAVPADPGVVEQRAVGFATVQGLGTGIVGGAGLTASAEGTTTRIAHAETPASPLSEWTDVWGLGFGGIGLGAVYDEAGDDRYVLEASTHAERHVEVTEGCGCAHFERPAEAVYATAVGMGAATGFGGIGVIVLVQAPPIAAGLLIDREGNDRYEVRAKTSAAVDMHDARQDPAQGAPARAEATSYGGSTGVMGYGFFVGQGVLRDEAGEDLYVVEASSSAETSTTSEQGQPPAASALAKPAVSWGQGMGLTQGYGELTDLSGTDRYVSIATSSAASDPPAGAVAEPAFSSVQAAVIDAGIALLLDHDGGSADEFVSVPANPACVGTRGHDVWADCGLGAGIGMNR